MAKINPVKVKQDAEKLEKAGKVEQAIPLYKQLVDDNPRDWNTIKKVGDLYVRLNKNKEAVVEYAKVADFYSRDGFLLKAIAIWKQINKLDPTQLEPYVHLADLYAKQGLMMEAKGQYQTVVDEYIKRGKIRDAGDVLKKMAEIDPGDLKVRSRLADLYTKEGNSEKAVGEYVAIAEELNKKGHLAEAVQVLEKGLKIEPRSHRLRLELGRIHLLQKNPDRAAHYLEEAVQHSPNDPKILVKLGEAYLGAKKIEEAEAIFKRLLELDPGDQETRVQMGRVYLLQGQFDKSFDEFAAVVDRLLERREGEKAALVLQQITQKNPQHIKTLVKLADVYRQLQKEAAVVQTYSQLTESYIAQGQYEQAASVLDILISMEPQNQQHRTKLQFVKGRKGGAPPPPPPAPPPPPRHAAPVQEIEEEEFNLEEEAPAPPPSRPLPRPAPAPAAPGAPRPAPARPRIEISGPLTEDEKEFIEEHLAEGRVFRKYGLVDKAADQFEAIVARYPDHLEARQELLDVHKEKGNSVKAAEQCLALAEICRLKGDAAGASAHEAEAQRLAPQAAPAAAPPRPAPPRPAPVPAPAPAPPPPAPTFAPAEEEEIALPEDEIVEEAEESGLEVPGIGGPGDEPFLEGDLGGGDELSHQFVEEEEVAIPGSDDVSIDVDEGPAIAAEPPAVVEDEEADLDISLDTGPGVELSLDEPAEEPPPPPPPKPKPKPKPFAPPAPPARPAPPSRPAPAPPPPPRAAAPRGPAVPADLQRVLEEVDSYVALGFIDDAREALREISGRYPAHPALQAKLAEIGLEEEPAPPPPPPPLPRPTARPTPPPAAPAPPRAAPPKAVPPKAPPPPPPPPAPAANPLDELADDPLADALDVTVPEPAEDDPLGDLGLPEPSPEPDLLGGLGGFAEEPAADLGLDGPSWGDAPAGHEAMRIEAEAPEPEPEPGSLEAELGELFGAQSAIEAVEAGPGGTDLGDAGLADIFKEFKKGVDRQLGKEDYDTRYNLGIAYKEMGLVDEAVAEFQLAAKDENRILECSSMLGLCFMEKGMPKLAIKWFEKGLKAPGRRDEEYLGLRYDLAGAFEAAGDRAKALGVYTDLYGQDANFRDVAAKVRELGGRI